MANIQTLTISKADDVVQQRKLSFKVNVKKEESSGKIVKSKIILEEMLKK